MATTSFQSLLNLASFPQGDDRVIEECVQEGRDTLAECNSLSENQSDLLQCMMTLEHECSVAASEKNSLEGECINHVSDVQALKSELKDALLEAETAKDNCMLANAATTQQVDPNCPNG